MYSYVIYGDSRMESVFIDSEICLKFYPETMIPLRFRIGRVEFLVASYVDCLNRKNLYTLNAVIVNYNIKKVICHENQSYQLQR